MFIMDLYDIDFYHKERKAKYTMFTKKTILHLVLTFVFFVVQFS
jgi:hypothetical protein